MIPQCSKAISAVPAYWERLIKIPQEILNYCNNKLSKLEEYDHANGTFLQETLLAYYMNGFNSAKTAEALFIHRNSLIYRLKKIEELLEIEITDYMEYLDLLNCILVKRLMFL